MGLPLDVRKGFAFPIQFLLTQEAMPPCGRSPAKDSLNGKAEPFRTSGGEAASRDALSFHPFNKLAGRSAFNERQTHNAPARGFDFFAAVNLIESVIAAFDQQIRQ